MAHKLTREIIQAAIDGYEAQKARIDLQIAGLRAMLNGGPAETAATPATPKGNRRRISAAGKARVAEAQRQRWAALKGESAARSPEPAKPKRRLSAAGRKNIVDALRRRWAAKKAEAASQGKKTASRAKRTAPARRKAPAKATAPAAA